MVTPQTKRLGNIELPPLPPSPGTIDEYAEALRDTLNLINLQLAANGQLAKDNVQILKDIATYLTPKEATYALTWPEGQPYSVLEFKLDEERSEDDPQEVRYEGDIITASTNGTLAGIKIRIHTLENDAIPLRRFNPIQYPGGFGKFYLISGQQTGKTLWLFVGRAAGASGATEITSAAPTSIFYSRVTDKDTHFTGAITNGNVENENISGMLSSKMRLQDIAIISKQPLHYFLFFWRKDTFNDTTDLDKDTFAGYVEIDLSKYGKRIGGTGSYYMSREDIDFDYEDEDDSDEIHVSLYNADATAKQAGANGEVVLYFKYELRG